MVSHGRIICLATGTMMKHKRTESTLYPLGRNIFATVKTWQGVVRIYVRHYKRTTNTKSGSLIPTKRGMALEMNEFKRLVKLKKSLASDFHQHISDLSVRKTDVSPPSSSSSSTNTPPAEVRTVTGPSTLETPEAYLTQCEQLANFPLKSHVCEGNVDNTGGSDIVKTAMTRAGLVVPNTSGRRQRGKTQLPWCPSPPDLCTVDTVMLNQDSPVVEPDTSSRESYTSRMDPGSPMVAPDSPVYNYYYPTEDPYIKSLQKYRCEEFLL